MGLPGWLKRRLWWGSSSRSVDGATDVAVAPVRRRRLPHRHRRRRAAMERAGSVAGRASVCSNDSTEYWSADELSSAGGASPTSPREGRPSIDDKLGRLSRGGGGSSRARSLAPPDAENVVEDGEQVVLAPVGDQGASRKRMVLLQKPTAGVSFRKKSPEVDAFDARECFDTPDCTTYSVRGCDYLRTRKKIPSGPALLQLLNIDVFATDFKLYHVARHLQLPPAPKISDEALARGFTPLVVFNLQCPLYNPSYFGNQDGEGGLLIYYFAFPEGWHPDHVENKAALDLLEKFFNDGVCDDGTTARERLKLIPRIANVEEWYRVGPLTATEYKLLVNYNDKPVLTRPQQRFYRGANYLEVDLDVHTWNFLCRKAFFGYVPKITSVVFENAFVLQGNAADELPEQVMGAVRVFRLDFKRLRESHRFPLRDEVDVQPPDV